MYAKDTLQADRRAFFDVIQNNSLTTEEVVSYYSNFLGPILADQRAAFLSRLKTYFISHGQDFEPSAVLNVDYSLSLKFFGD